MGQLNIQISTSLDGFVAGPNQTRENPLGEGGESLHEWAFATAGWREAHGREGGTTGPEDDLAREMQSRHGAEIMGRNKFGGGPGPWDADEPWNGWWGDDPPFPYPVFVLTHHEREPLTLGQTTFTFVTDGIESALEQARAAAGDRDVLIGGGAQVCNEYLAAGLVDELLVHVAPILLGGGERLFEGVPPAQLECTQVVESAQATHLRYRVAR
ncbi:MAG: dihydrofolate reductase family protein [Actinomycetota bacterium]|nr:dihydrofolate reductase family protein [Actinomycetota bacterium]